MGPNWLNNDVIVALATPRGSAGVAIIRMSGPDAVILAERLVKLSAFPLQSSRPRELHYCSIFLDGQLLDRGLVVWFPKGHSYTGDEVVEFHVHGNMVLVDLILDALTCLGARPANAGEFTFRAYRAGKLQLSQVEALAELLQAQNRRSLLASQAAFGGSLHNRVHGFHSELLNLLVRLELSLDFMEEGYADVSADLIQTLLERLETFILPLIACFQSNRLRNGVVRVVLTGSPNAGKSSLFNSLLGYPRAIVSHVPGTTRDFIEATIEQGGVTWQLVDTAGIRSSDDTIEAQGIQHALDELRLADIIIFLVDLSLDASSLRHELETVDRFKSELPDIPIHICGSKYDLISSPPLFPLTYSIHSTDHSLFWDTLKSQMQGNTMDTPSLSLRQLSLLRDLQRQITLCKSALCEPIEVQAVMIRQLLSPLESFVGITTNDDVLAEVFSSFCIGK